MAFASPSSSRILVTGARGSLATILAAHFARTGQPVEKFSRTSGDGFRSLDELVAARDWTAGDTILHLAWSTVPFSAEQNPGAESAQDLPLLRRILDQVAAKPAASRPHFVFFSSGGTVYGRGSPGRAHREDDDCAPIGRHGQAKLAAENLIREHAKGSGISWTILRVSNPYGFPVPPERRQGIIPVAIKAAREGQVMTLWGDGTARKDFLHYSDFGDAVARVVARRVPGILNVGSGESHTIREVLDLVEEATGRRIATKHVPAFPWDVHDSQLDNSRLKAAVGWKPRIALAEGIRLTAGAPNPVR
jgi:UDP-glucose 4-epimerase